MRFQETTLKLDALPRQQLWNTPLNHIHIALRHASEATNHRKFQLAIAM
jgi:hypothetical protein